MHLAGTPGLDPGFDEPDEVAARLRGRVVDGLERMEDRVGGRPVVAVSREHTPRDAAQRFHPPECRTESRHILGVRLAPEDRVDLVERVAGSLEYDRPAAVEVVFEDAQPGEQELRLISPEELDTALVRHRQAVLRGGPQQLAPEVAS